MLKSAYLYADELKRKYAEAICDDYFKFYTSQSYSDFRFEVYDNEWNTIQRVSVDRYGNIIGLIIADINVDTKNVTNFGLINFTKQPNKTFSLDVLRFLREMKDVKHANKFEFMAYAGSPAEEMYRRFIEKHGGRVVGIKKRTNKLSDGKYYDGVIFEILREEMNF